MSTLAIPNTSAVAGSQTVVRDQIRGSGLLVVGKVLSAAVTALCQVLIVRHLSTSAYGSFAYAMAVVIFWQSMSNFGFHEAIARFFPIYHQRGDYSRMFGTIVLSLVFITLAGIAVIATFFLWPHQVLRFVHEQAQSLDCLFILIFLVPVEAIDALLMATFASLGSARAIFFRRHIVAPGLKLAAVLLMLMFRGDAVFLAFGFLVASVLGLVYYGWVLLGQFRDQGLLSRVRFRELCFPLREVFSFTVPMMTSDIVSILNQSVVVMILGYYFGLRDVAFLRVVIPAAAMNEMIAVTTALLYLPAASRMFASGDQPGLRDLYWRTAAWIAVLSFPIFTLTFCFARPVTILMYGHRYADSGILLSILSVGYYFDTVFGFNGLTLKAANRMSYMVGCNVGAAIANIALSLTLIPRYGALGAAISIAASLAVLGILKQVALTAGTGISVVDRKFISLYVMLGVAVCALLLIHKVATANIYLGLLLASLAVTTVFLVARKELMISEMFPEIARLPLVRRIFA